MVAKIHIPHGIYSLNFLDDDNSDQDDEKMDNLMEDLSVLYSFRYIYRQNIPKSVDWFNNVLPSYDENRFRQMMRVSRESFNMILQEIENDPIFYGDNSSLQFNIPKQLAITLYCLGAYGDECSVRKVGSKLGLGDGGTVNKIMKRIFTVTVDLNKYLFSFFLF